MVRQNLSNTNETCYNVQVTKIYNLIKALPRHWKSRSSGLGWQRPAGYATPFWNDRQSGNLYQCAHAAALKMLKGAVDWTMLWTLHHQLHYFTQAYPVQRCSKHSHMNTRCVVICECTSSKGPLSKNRTEMKRQGPNTCKFVWILALDGKDSESRNAAYK